MTDSVDLGVVEIEGRKVDLDAGRRAFVKYVGAGAAAAAGLNAVTLGSAKAQTATDIAVLNFALNLEYLESNFYVFAATGAGIPLSLRGAAPGQLLGGKKAKLTSPLVKAYSAEIANDELNHVKFLRAALGSAAVDMPTIDIGTAFTTAARAAGVISQTQTFDAYASDTNFLLAAYIFEDVGVTAYHGAAPLLADNATYLDAAAGILAVEAYHAGIIRTALFASGTASRPTALISNLRQKLGPVKPIAANTTAPGNGDVGVGTNANPTLLNADGLSIAYDRTTNAVLNVVYGAQATNKGLFFPNGLNGAITASTGAM